MRRMLLFAAWGYFFGSALILAASFMSPAMAVYWVIYLGLLLTGLGWGAVEAATNPLVAAAYPEEKTHRLNILHAWWPAGIVIGGLVGIFVAGAMALAGQFVGVDGARCDPVGDGATNGFSGDRAGCYGCLLPRDVSTTDRITRVLDLVYLHDGDGYRRAGAKPMGQCDPD